MTQELCRRLEPGSRIASFGYPDMVAPLDVLEEFVEVRELEYRKDSEAICKRHGLNFRGIPDAHAFFRTMKCELDVYDVVRERGCEILCDLNEIGMGISYTRGGIFECYEFVLDVGTIEHCFNVGLAAKNMAGMLKKGGVIFHENPFAMPNHGFYSLNPTFYTDFYEQNGFKVLDCKLILKDGRIGDVPRTQRFKYNEDCEANVFAIAERVEVKELVFPVQTKYKGLIPSPGSRADKGE